MRALTIYSCNFCFFWSYKLGTKEHKWTRPPMPVPEDCEDVVHVTCPQCKPERRGILFTPETSLPGWLVRRGGC